jgi:hypothetical protein
VGRAPIPHLLALACGFVLAVFVATGCGGDRANLIPSQRASDLVGQLDDIKSQIDSGDCSGLATKVDTFHDDATSLTKPVDSRLRKRINDGVKSLQAHAVDDCQAAAQAQTQTQTTDTTTTETQTTETVPTTTTTTPTTTTETTPTTTTETTPTTPSDTSPAPTDTGSTAAPPDTGGTSGEGTTP